MSANCKLYCKKTKVNESGKAPIYLVLRMEGVKAEKLVATGKYIAPEHFDNKTGMVTGGRNTIKLNRVLQTYLEDMEWAILELEA